MMSKVVILMLCGEALFSSFEYRPSGATRLFPFTEAAVEYTVPGRADTGSYAALTATPALSFSVERPYSLNELVSAMTLFTMPAGGMGLMLSWSCFGMEGYRENIVKGGTGYSFGEIFTTGIDLAWYGLAIDMDAVSLRKNYYDLQWSGVLTVFSLLDISFTLENIKSLAMDDDDSFLVPCWSGGLRFVPARGLSLAWNMTKSSGTLVNMLSATAHILPEFSLSMGYVHETASCSASALVLYGHVSSSYCMKFHPHLGTSHSFSVTLLYDRITLPALQFEKTDKLSRGRGASGKTVDINTCTQEELTTIPVLEEVYAERIFNYRQLIGPVSEKSLYQIGMKSADIDVLHEYIHGLVREEKPLGEGERKKWQGKKGLYHEERRRMFTLLVEAGISPVLSLKITERAKEGGIGAVYPFLEGNGEIDEIQKERIRKICASFR